MTEPAIQQKAFELCSTLLGDEWSNRQKLQVDTIHGGVTNKLYLCSLIENGEKVKSVVYRVYGLIMDNVDAQITESVVFSLLGSQGIGPKLHGIFPGGRLEEYIEGSNLVCRDLANPAASRAIAQQVAMFHKLEMPVQKSPVLKKQLLNYREKCNDLGINLTKYEADIDYVCKLVDSSKSPIIFCHNDVHEGNCLIDERKLTVGQDRMEALRLIDFEYSNYGYRGFEFGNHFCEWMYDYTNPEAPYYYYKPEHWPTYDEMANFIDEYLKHSETDSTRDELIAEANDFALVSHIYWMLWSFVQAEVSDITFGYHEYGLVRHKSYLKLRASIDNNNAK